MRLRAWFPVSALFLSLLLQGLSSAGARGVPATKSITYSISLDHPELHLFHVQMAVPDVAGELIVQMPAWNALYQIRDFGNHLQRVEAHVGKNEVPIEKIDKQTWRIQGTGTVSIEYAAYWDEAGPFASQLNAEHAFINPAMILMYVPDRRNEPVTISLRERPRGWGFATSLEPLFDDDPTSSSKTFLASSYEALADAPIEAGTFSVFQVPGIMPPIFVAIHGDNWSRKRVESDLSKICEYELRLMGGAPFKDYRFILHIGKGSGGGGMEHANSTAIGLPSDDYLDNVAAHEFFHLWNVKRIRPASLEPVDYTKEQYTRALWFAEGVTSTYGAYTLMRTGLWTKERAYADLSDQISELESRPANHWQSAEESSLDAWLEKYPLYNGPDYSVSYYTKGQVLGVLLDLLIRDRTNNAKSLDDVMRGLNADFAKHGKFYRDSLDIRLEAEEVAGGSFEDFFRDYVAAAKPLPYTETFALAGLEVRHHETKIAVLGFAPDREAAGGGVPVRAVDDGSPAAGAGLRPGDVIVSWNGGEAPRSLRRWVRDRQPGESVKARIRRDDKELNLEFKLGEEQELRYQVAEDPNAGEKARRIREGWLRGTTGAIATH